MRADFPFRVLLRALGVRQDDAELPPQRADFNALELRVGLEAERDVWGGLRRRAFTAGAAAPALAAEYAALQLAAGGSGLWILGLIHNTIAAGVVRVGSLPAPLALTGAVVVPPQAFDDGRTTPSSAVVTAGTLPVATVDAAGVVTGQHNNAARIDTALLGWFIAPGAAFLLTASIANLATTSALWWVEARAEHEPRVR